MRNHLDRLRHTLLFELIAVGITVPVVHWLTNQPVTTIGGLTLTLSLLAMGWNYLYNWLFDHWELRLGWRRPRSLGTRVLHALGFEAGLLLAGLAIIAAWLAISLWQAFLIDLGFMLFFLFYALVYNWAYDRIFPVPVVNGQVQVRAC